MFVSGLLHCPVCLIYFIFFFWWGLYPERTKWMTHSFCSFPKPLICPLDLCFLHALSLLRMPLWRGRITSELLHLQKELHFPWVWVRIINNTTNSVHASKGLVHAHSLQLTCTPKIWKKNFKKKERERENMFSVTQVNIFYQRLGPHSSIMVKMADTDIHSFIMAVLPPL